MSDRDPLWWMTDADKASLEQAVDSQADTPAVYDYDTPVNEIAASLVEHPGGPLYWSLEQMTTAERAELAAAVEITRNDRRPHVEQF